MRRWLSGGALVLAVGALVGLTYAEKLPALAGYPLAVVIVGLLGAVLKDVLVDVLKSGSQERRAAGRAQRAALWTHAQHSTRKGGLPKVRDHPDPARLDSRGRAEPRTAAYVPRDLDAEVGQALRDRRMVLLTGPSAAGKTRAAFEAIRRLDRRRPLRLLVPARPDSLGELARAGVRLTDTVIWLDDLETYLGRGDLDRATLDKLVNPGDGRARVLVVATMRAQARRALEDAPGSLPPEASLRTLFRHFVPADEPHWQDASDFADALDWATTREDDVAACLNRVDDDLYQPFDYLVDHVQSADEGMSAPVWDAVCDLLAPEDALPFAGAARKAGRLPIAERALRAALDVHPDRGELLCPLGSLLWDDERVPEAEPLFRRACDAGDGDGANALGLLHALRGETGAAERLYRLAVARGSAEARNNLGVLRAQLDESFWAEEALKPAVAAGLPEAVRNLDRLRAWDRLRDRDGGPDEIVLHRAAVRAVPGGGRVPFPLPEARTVRLDRPRPDPTSSRTESTWEYGEIGVFRNLAGDGVRELSWLSPSMFWHRRNETLARVFGDPSDDLRRRWVAGQRDRGAEPDAMIVHDRPMSSFLLLGSTGGGGAGQYAVVPGLLKTGADTDFMIICGDVLLPAAGAPGGPRGLLWRRATVAGGWRAGTRSTRSSRTRPAISSRRSAGASTITSGIRSASSSTSFRAAGERTPSPLTPFPGPAPHPLPRRDRIPRTGDRPAARRRAHHSALRSGHGQVFHRKR